MPTIAPKQSSNYEQIKAGTHIARLYQILHIGTQDVEWQGQIKQQYKIRLSFEFPNQTKVFKEGEPAKPMVLSQEYTLSMGEKANLRKIVEGMIGTSLQEKEAESFDLEDLLGKACLVSVKHKESKGKMYANIATTAPLMEGQVAPAQVNESRVIGFVNWNQEVFDKLPKFIQEKIQTSPEYQSKFAPSNLSDDEKNELARMREEHGNPPKIEYPADGDIPF